MSKDLINERRLALSEGHALEVGTSELSAAIQRAWNLQPIETPAHALCRLNQTKAPGSSTHFPAATGVFLEDGRWMGRLSVDFAQFAPGCDLDVYKGVQPDDLLPWINVLLPSAGVLPIHASAFRLKSTNILYAGFAHSGKTGLLMAAAAAGAKVIGDECIWLTTGGQLQGLNLPMEVQLKYLKEFPVFVKRIPAADLQKAKGFKRLAAAVRTIHPRFGEKLSKRARMTLPFDALFDGSPSRGRLDTLLLSTPCSSRSIELASVTKDEAVARLLEIQLAEFRPILNRYAEYRYHVPGTRNAWLDALTEALRPALEQALGKIPCFLVRHPYPVTAKDLLHAITQTI